MGRTLASAWIASAIGLVGCAFELDAVDVAQGGDEGDLGETRAALVAENGQHLNGQHLNGQHLNGQHLNGQHLNTSSLGGAIAWVELDGAGRNGATYDAVELDGSQLRGWIGSGAIDGTAFAGSHFLAVSDTGATLSLRVAEVTAPPAGGDVWRYVVEYQETDGSWQPTCLDPATDAPTGGVALGGYWNTAVGAGGGDKIDDTDRLTFACPKIGAIGKCVDMGYRPWAASAGGVALGGHHQTCTRLIRNDYCGTGVSHTLDGNLINLYDGVGIQADTAPWLPEAEWDEHGARCITLNNRQLLALPCSLQLDLFCGAKSHFNTGTKLITERPLLGLL